MLNRPKKYEKEVPEGRSVGKMAKSTPKLNQLATHVPDLVNNHDHSKPFPNNIKFNGVLMFADISGFTALSERYSMNAKIGVDQLTKTLNGYLEALVAEIIGADADILKFAGDAILSVWSVDGLEPETMRDAIKHVIHCALRIQDRCGEWLTDVGVKLRVKLGIAAGEMCVTYIGNDEFRHYVTTGITVDDVNLAEKFCESGFVVISPYAWMLLPSEQFEFEVMEDDKHIRVLSSKVRGSYDISRTLSMETFVETPTRSPQSKRTSLGKDSDNEPKTTAAAGVKGGTVTKIRFRKSVLTSMDKQTEDAVRLYIARPVLKKLDDDQPLEYLSENRQVSIVFMNMVLAPVPYRMASKLLQSAFDIIYPEVRSMLGCLNKVFMFDKGCTFLVIFGLPGYKHENDCAHALQCSYRMKKKLDMIKNVQQTSIGVTTGMTFCGVVGHPYRHEYTVIGKKVNMAARLMMHYPGKVTCDNDTYHHSKLSRANFKNLELKKMKGLINIGTIREYTEEAVGNSLYTRAPGIQEFDFPIVGRENEIRILMYEIKSIMEHKGGTATQRQVIIFEGEAGIGKSRILDAVVCKAEESHIKVLSSSLSMNEAKTPYFVVRSLLMSVLEFSLTMSHQEREDGLRKYFQKDMYIMQNLCLLNDLLVVQFSCDASVRNMSKEERASGLRKLLVHIMHQITTKTGFIIFVIDDAQFVDPESWTFMSDMGRDDKTLVVLSMRPFTETKKSQQPVAFWEVLHSETSLTIRLKPLDEEHITAIACQLLEVAKIPQKLDDFLKMKTHGVPAWCEQILHELFHDAKITLVPEGHPDTKDFRLVGPPPNFLKKKERFTQKSKISSLGQSSEEEDHTIMEGGNLEGASKTANLVCVLQPDVNLRNVALSQSMKGMMMARMDRMEPSDQMLIKCASIIGAKFSRKMVEVIMPNQIPEKIKASIKRLMESGILECASDSLAQMKESKIWNQNSGGIGKDIHALSLLTSKAECYCPRPDGKPGPNDSVTNCQFLRFHNGLMQETAYETFLGEQRRMLHIEAAGFLESQAHKCPSCGGGEFIAWQSLNNVVAERNRRESNVKEMNKHPKSITRGSIKVDRQFKRDRRSSAVTPEITFSSVPVSVESLTAEELEEARDQVDSSALLRLANTQQRRASIRITLGLDEPTKTESFVSTVIPDVDFRSCECVNILASVYPQLVRHWRSAGNVGKTVHFLLEAAAAATATHNTMQTLSFLEEAAEIAERVTQNKNPFPNDIANIEELSDFYVDPEEIALIESLTGQSKFQLGQMDEALPHFKSALKILGSRQPETNIGVNFEIIRQGMTQVLHLKNPERFIGSAPAQKKVRLVEQTRCLSHLFQYYYTQDDAPKALLTALQQVNKSEEADSDLHELILAYTCLMECCQLKNWPNLANRYIQIAMDKITLAMDSMNPEDWLTFAHLFKSAMTVQLSNSHIKDAIESGFAATRIIAKLHDTDAKIQVLPLMGQALLMTKH
ncbi:unnamed protein product [Owenia fusiformis]|uniref:Guanylate cyclase domain-containing protein n=1 Tax=Owenia fusiformis TaxID=6347 RepID=A0A8S4PD08_OWEFU|nr:unnamed protein product [Owenia fusiformis]